MLLILFQNKRKLNPLICTLQSWTLKIFIRKCPKVFPVPCWLIVVDLLIFLWFMFVSLHRAMTLKSLKLPIPANLNRSLRSVLDCYHWLPKSKGEIEENGSSWCISILSKASWCILLIYIAQINPDDFLDWEGDFSPKEEDRLSDFGRLFWFWQCFPSEGIGGGGDSWVLNCWCSLLCSRRARNCE